MNANTQFASDLITWPKPINEVPKIVFDDEQIYQAELQKLFYGRIWHPVAHEAEVPNPGDYKTIHVGELPIIISRDRDGQVHALHNACAHRGTMVATAFMGNVDNFECHMPVRNCRTRWSIARPCERVRLGVESMLQGRA